jgi:hypothetical protein
VMGGGWEGGPTLIIYRGEADFLRESEPFGQIMAKTAGFRGGRPSYCAVCQRRSNWSNSMITTAGAQESAENTGGPRPRFGGSSPAQTHVRTGGERSRQAADFTGEEWFVATRKATAGYLSRKIPRADAGRSEPRREQGILPQRLVRASALGCCSSLRIGV